MDFHLTATVLVLIAGMLTVMIYWLGLKLTEWLVSQKNKKVYLEQFEIANEGMALISLRWRFMKVNKALCKSLGFESNELLNMDLQRLIHPDDFNHSLPQLKQILEGQLPVWEAQQRYLDNRGDLKTFTVNVSAARDKSGKPRHFISQFKNVQPERV